MKSRLFRRVIECWRIRGTFPFLLMAMALSALAAAQGIRLHLGLIAFFGYEGIDLPQVRAALPVREGEEVSQDTWNNVKKRIQKTVEEVTGHPPTDVATVCCDKQGALLLYVGLAGRSYHTFRYNPLPTGSLRLPPEAVRLDTQMDQAMQDAVLKGQAQEDDSHGYALLAYPPARVSQEAVRTYALAHEPLFQHALTSSSEASQRRIAATFLGYARSSRKQIDALVYASRDQDEDVRNAATRALGVLAHSSTRIARQIPAANFIAMLNSGIWTDRNKAGNLLAALSEARDPHLLAQLRAEALASLMEMARWDEDHATAARMILGRIAGIPDKQLQQLAASGQVEAILTAVQKMR